jgi:RecB family exonuclease
MACTVYTGPAGSGKSTFAARMALSRAAGLAAEVRVAVPTALQRQAWRERLTAAGAIGVHIYDYNGLVYACLNAAGQTYTEVDPLVRFHLVRALARELDLPHYGPIRQTPGFVQSVQDVIERLKSAQISPEAFAEAVNLLGAEPRLVDLATIYAAYQTRLKEQGWADIEGLRWLAVEAVSADPNACAGWPLLVVDGFDDFTAVQLSLLRLLAQRVGEMVVMLPAGERADYPRYARTRERVEQALGVAARPLPARDGGDGRAPGLRRLAAGLFSDRRPGGDGPQPAPDEPPALELRQCPDLAAEAREALRWLKARIVRDGVAPERTALLARDITPYRPFITEAASEFGLPLHLVDGLPLPGSPVIDALLDLLRLHLPISPESAEPALPRRAVIATWRSPYFAWDGIDPPIRPLDADRLDLLARRGLVIRGLRQWREAFDAAGYAAARRTPLPVEDELLEAPAALTTGTVARLRQQFDAFLAATRPPDATAMRDYVRWFEGLLGDDGHEVEPEDAARTLHVFEQAESSTADAAALQALKSVLRGLVWVEEALPAAGAASQVSFTRFYDELAGALSAARYDPSPRAGTGILVTDVVRARGLSFDAAAVLGLSEGAFPATISEDPFLRDRDRARLSRQFGYQLDPSTDSAEREFFYEAVTRPRDRLLLTRATLADNGALWEPSPFWEAARAHAPGTPSEGTGPAASPVEQWELAATAGQAVAAAGGAWSRIVAAAAAWRARETAGTDEGDLAGAAAELSADYGPGRHIWSASSLEKYQTCGYTYFITYTLGLEPREEPEEGLDAAQLGSLYHQILESVTRADLPEAGDLRAVIAGVARPILEGAPRRLGFRATRWWDKTAGEIIDNVTEAVASLRQGGWTFWRAEERFGYGGQAGLVLQDGDERIELRGVIDRVDRDAGGRVRIIDYKISSPSRYGDRQFREGRLLQLPLYALAAEQALHLGPVADGFYWHLLRGEASGFRLSGGQTTPDAAIQVAAAEAWAAVRAIRAGRFRPEPPTEGCPAYCPAAAFCWHYTPGW